MKHLADITYYIVFYFHDMRIHEMIFIDEDLAMSFKTAVNGKLTIYNQTKILQK